MHLIAIRLGGLEKIMKKIFLLSLLSFFLVTPVIVLAQANITISSSVPGMGALTSNAEPGAYVSGFYNFALMIGGVLAFGAIVYGGILYATSAGNSSKQSEGRSWITSALLGLLLLAGAYLILYTINPNLVNLSLPTLQAINIEAPTSGSSDGNGCASGTCQTLSNCTVTSVTNCGAAQGMIDTMACIQQKDPNLSYRVTEGYPPTVAHSSAGHNTGCAIDVKVTSANTCQSISALQAAASACGTNALNEYASCSGTTYKTTTGNNVHINSIKGDGGC